MSTYNNNSEEWPGSIAGLCRGVIACSISTIHADTYTYSPNVTIAIHFQTLYSSYPKINFPEVGKFAPRENNPLQLDLCYLNTQVPNLAKVWSDM